MLAEGQRWGRRRQRGGTGPTPCLLGRMVTGSDRSRHSQKEPCEQRPGGRKLPEAEPVPLDTYLQVPTSLAERLLCEALGDAASLQAGQTALVGRRRLGAPGVGWRTRARGSCLGLAQAQLVPISGHGCMEACCFHGHRLPHSLPGSGGEDIRPWREPGSPALGVKQSWAQGLVRQPWVPTLALSPSSYVTLGKTPPLYEPYFSQL